jgi:hypothetical protein
MPLAVPLAVVRVIICGRVIIIISPAASIVPESFLRVLIQMAASAVSTMDLRIRRVIIHDFLNRPGCFAIGCSV